MIENCQSGIGEYRISFEIGDTHHN